MEIQPFGERVVIKVVQPETISAGGLIMTTSKEKSKIVHCRPWTTQTFACKTKI